MWIIKFYWFDLDLDLMILVLKLNLDIVKMYVCTKHKAPAFISSKVIAWTARQTDRLAWNYYLSTYADGKYISVVQEESGKSGSHYCPQTKLWKGNVFTAVCHSVHSGEVYPPGQTHTPWQTLP